jgi:hypothetical protein
MGNIYWKQIHRDWKNERSRDRVTRSCCSMVTEFLFEMLKML